MQLNKTKLAILLASFDSSIQPLFPVTDDAEAAFNAMLQAVPEEHRQSLSAAYMQMQNVLFVKMGALTRELFNVDINDPLLTLHSRTARVIFDEYHNIKDDQEPDGSYCLSPDEGSTEEAGN